MFEIHFIDDFPAIIPYYHITTGWYYEIFPINYIVVLLNMFENYFNYDFSLVIPYYCKTRTFLEFNNLCIFFLLLLFIFIPYYRMPIIFSSIYIADFFYIFSHVLPYICSEIILITIFL